MKKYPENKTFLIFSTYYDVIKKLLFILNFLMVIMELPLKISNRKLNKKTIFKKFRFFPNNKNEIDLVNII